MTKQEQIQAFSLAMEYFDKAKEIGWNDKLEGLPPAVLGLGDAKGYVTPWNAGYVAGYNEEQVQC